MLQDLRNFSRVKDSGLKWVGLVPEHWQVQRSKTYFREVNDRSAHGEEELLSVSHKTGVTPRREKKVTMFLAESNVGDKLCRPGDVVVNTMWAWMAAMGVASHGGIVSPSYGVFRPTNPDLFLAAYLDRLLRTPPYRSEYVARSTGITSSRLRLYPDQFLRIPILRPPPDEQAAIVRFLDYANERIRSYIRGKQKLIDLLEEQVAYKTREAMNHPQSVARRLGRISVQQLRSVRRHNTRSYRALGLRNRGRGIFHKPERPGSELGSSTFFWVEPGDAIISGQFAWEGAIALAARAERETIVSHRYYLLRGVEGTTTTPYLVALLRSDFGEMLLDHHSRGAAGRNRPLNLRTLLKEKVPVPPYDVQLALDEFIRSLAPLRERMQAQIDLVREFRTRLVTDVVTGKIDVRESAANLPDTRGELQSDNPDLEDDVEDADEDEGMET